MKVIFRWVQNCHHEPGFLSVHDYCIRLKIKGNSIGTQNEMKIVKLFILLSIFPKENRNII